MANKAFLLLGITVLLTVPTQSLILTTGLIFDPFWSEVDLPHVLLRFMLTCAMLQGIALYRMNRKLGSSIKTRSLPAA